MGRVALVTGGSRGIGAAIAKKLKEDGCVVAATYGGNDEAAAAFTAETGIKTYKWSVGDYDACKAGVTQIEADLGPVDILVNNAGAVGTIGNVWEQPLENWQRMLTLNLTATFQCCRAIAPHMIGNGYGRIVNIASNAGKMGVPGNSPYAAAKAGVISLTKTMAREAAKTGVLVNAVAPGGANTELFDDLDKEYRSQIEDGMALGRLVEPEEVAAIAAWAASEDCSFTTGAVFDISGGRADF